jgi:hypothetical protein
MREAIVGTDDGEDPLSVLDIEYVVVIEGNVRFAIRSGGGL